MLTRVILRLQAIDLTTFSQGTASAMMRVPSTCGRREFRMQHRDVLLDCRHHGGRMEHFGAEVGQFGGFGEGNRLDAMAAGQDGRIGGEHAVDVGPDLDFFGLDAGADDRGGEVRSAAAERGGDAVVRRADEAAHHDDGVFGQGGDGRASAGRKSPGRSGRRWVWRLSVTMTLRESTCTAFIPKWRKARVTM